jgi:hypothetical protein
MYALQTEPADESKDLFFSGYAVSMAEDAVSSVYLPETKRKNRMKSIGKISKNKNFVSEVRRSLCQDPQYFL